MDHTRSQELPLRTGSHFLDHLQALPLREPHGGSLARELRAADWYPAGGRALRGPSTGRELAVLGVEVGEGLLDLITIYPPKRG